MKAPADKQRGAVLMVSLVLLLVLTLLGISGIESTILQEKMTGSVQDRERAFQAAEAALRDAENYISDDTLHGTLVGRASCLGGICAPASGTNAYDVWEDSSLVNWSTGSNTLPYGTASGSSLPIVARQPAYIIELMQVVVPGETDPETFYRITAKGYGRNLGTSGEPVSQAMLQSFYRK